MARPVTASFGKVAERFIAPDFKSGDLSRDPWVRIPPFPPLVLADDVEVGHAPCPFKLGYNATA